MRNLDQHRVDVWFSYAWQLTCRGSQLSEEVVEPMTDQDVLIQRYRPPLGDHHGHLAAHLGQPLAKLLCVAHRCRERDELDGISQTDDHLFPHRTPKTVGQVVHLIQHDVAEVGQRGRPRIDHVAQHLGRHHHNGRLGIDRCVPGKQSDVAGAMPAHQVGVLLVRQGLDRCRVEALAAGA